MNENEEEKLKKEEESEYISESQSFVSKNTIRSSSLSSLSSQINTKEKFITKKITNIINSFKNQYKNSIEEKNEEMLQNACNGLIQFTTTNNIDILSIEDSLKNNLINYYCSSQEYFNLKIILLALEKQNIDKNAMNIYFLGENNNDMNIFETASELGDIKIFNILKKYLIGNDYLLKGLLKPYRDNIFHIAAKNNQIISLLFYYSFYKNNNCIEIQNKNSKTPLHLSCYKNYYDFSCMLINFGINMDLQDKDGKTAMFYALEKQSIKIIKNLILNGANKYIRDNNNNRCIDYINLQNKNEDYENNLIMYNILKHKNMFVKIFKCPIIYQSLKNHHKHIFMLIFILFLIILQSTILIFFLYYKYKSIDINMNNELFFDHNTYIIEFVLILADLLTEVFIILIFWIFSCNKNKQKNKEMTYEKELYELYNDNNNINIKLCVRCHAYMNINTKHCISCDECIEDWDHHCFWLNTCINKKNFKYFKLFLLNAIMSLLLNITTYVFIFIEIFNHPKIYNVFLFKNDDFINKNDFDYISIIMLVFDCFLFLINLIFLISFIIPFICDLICEEKDSKKYAKKLLKDSNTSMNLKLLYNSTNSDGTN